MEYNGYMVVCLECGNKQHAITFLHLKACCGLDQKEYLLRHPGAEIMDAETKSKCSKPMESNPNWKGGLSHKKCKDCGRSLSPHNRGGRCKKCSKLGKRNHFFGKKHSEKGRKRMSDSQRKRDPKTRHVIILSHEKRSRMAKNRWDGMTKPQREKHILPFIKAGLGSNKKSSQTKIEVAVGKILDLHNIPYRSNVQIDRYNVDILLDGEGVIECYGDFWHCNPMVYGPGYYNKSLHCTSTEKWEKDKRRREYLQKIGFHVIVLWESDIKNNLFAVERKLLDAIAIGKTNNLRPA